MIFKDSAEINKKEKDKTVFKTAYNRTREVKHTISKVKRGGLPGFAKVKGGKVDFFSFIFPRWSRGWSESARANLSTSKQWRLGFGLWPLDHLVSHCSTFFLS
jgi:hypothetical protein